MLLPEQTAVEEEKTDITLFVVRVLYFRLITGIIEAGTSKTLILGFVWIWGLGQLPA